MICILVDVKKYYNIEDLIGQYLGEISIKTKNILKANISRT